MANDYSRNPMVFNTTMPATYKNTAGIPNNLSIYPVKWYWTNPSATGDQIVFEDPAGLILFQTICELAPTTSGGSVGQGQFFDAPEAVRWNDFQLTTISSGTFYLYFKT